MSNASDRSLALSRPGPMAPSRSVSQLVPVEPATKPSIRILVADDERTLRESCASVLGVEGYNVTVTGRGEEALDLLRRRPFDIVLVDLYMNPVSGMDLLAAALAANPDTIAIVITGKPSVEGSLEVLRAGAWDYLPKPFTGSQLQILVGRAAHAVAVARESRVLHEQNGVHPSDRVAVLGSAAKYNEVIALARRVAATDASVFITGESGSGKELIAQFIAATNRDPEEAVAAGALREDLYYRLRVVPIHVPALRERVDDIPLLAEHFLGYYWDRHRAREEPVPHFSKAAIWALRAHSWPGNVRELQNVIEHAVVLLEPGADVRPEDVPFISDHGSDPELGALDDPSEGGLSYYEARDRLLARFDRRFLTRVVIRAGGNLSHAARMAKVDRTTFYRLMSRHGLQRNLLPGSEDEGSRAVDVEAYATRDPLCLRLYSPHPRPHQ